jgi:2-methylcitrate dehydratase PrpD
MVAIMLIDKGASFAAAHDKARMQDPEILRHRAKVELVADDELQRRMPQRQAIVELTFTDGTQLGERVEAVRGTAANPMDRAEVVAKCRELTAPVLGAAKADRLIQTVLTLETTRDLRQLRPLLQRA